MARPLRGDQTAGHQSRRGSAESSPMPHSGQQPGGRGVADQRSVQAAGPSRPPKPRARATHAAPSVATSAFGKH
eukprot:14347138-Alexandrium_andersonii.AAC.1